jgi:quercetin dioxygenase-like cupin family protein
VEIRRFGVGNRRPDGPPGTTGIAGQVIHSDGRGVVSELAFARRAAIEPHSNPSTTWFVVIEGGGWVQVGEERARVAAGEAVLWPADTVHGAWTELSEMRAIVVEFAGADDAAVRGIFDGRAQAPRSADDSGPAGAAAGGDRADGALREAVSDAPQAAAEGEPL